MAPTVNKPETRAENMLESLMVAVGVASYGDLGVVLL
jgi:hypothetical protein